jgi:hypothetical protein
VFSLTVLSGCTIIGFEKGLNYEEMLEYKYSKGSGLTTIFNKKNGKHITIGLGAVDCEFYGLVGPLIFPVIPIWENKNCDKVGIGIWEHKIGIKNVHLLYQNKIYQSQTSNSNFYTFPLQTKSINETAILVVEKQDGEKFEIPFRYQHSFSFAFFPGR